MPNTWDNITTESIQRVLLLACLGVPLRRIQEQTGISTYYIKKILENPSSPPMTRKNSNIHGMSNHRYGILKRGQTVK